MLYTVAAGILLVMNLSMFVFQAITLLKILCCSCIVAAQWYQPFGEWFSNLLGIKPTST